MSNTLPEYIPNSGQLHPGIAGVWSVPASDSWRSMYRGSGPVLARVDARRRLMSFEYVPVDGDGQPVEIREAANAAEPGQYILPAMASCWEICIDTGTTSAAVLAALGGADDER